MSELQKFNFKDNEVRIHKDENGEPWFVASDVCKVLGIINPTKACQQLDDDEVTALTFSYTGKSGKKLTNRVNLISESGLYALILRSNKPEAKPFRKWVTSEVLPAIRKDGGYIATKPDDDEASIMARAVLIAQSTINRQKETIEEQKRQLQAQAPMVDYCNTILAIQSLMTVNSIAAHLGVSAKRLNAFLAGEGLIYKQGGMWYPSCKIRNKGFCDYDTVSYTNHAGEQCSKHHLKWTELGRKEIIDLWNRQHNLFDFE